MGLKKPNEIAEKYLITALCTACDACAPICPTDSIAYGITQYVIDRDTCSGCRVCVNVCPVNAIIAFEQNDDEEEEES